MNGATCTDRAMNVVPICACVTGYTGLKCQTDINECASAPCKNAGVCQDLVNTFKCQCVAGYVGTVCQTNFNECASNPCQNGGTCIDAVNSFQCMCRPGYSGVQCETDISECGSSPCQNGGTCSEPAVNMFFCNCAPGMYRALRCAVCHLSLLVISFACLLFRGGGCLEHQDFPVCGVNSISMNVSALRVRMVQRAKIY